MWSFSAAIPFRYTAESATNHEEEFPLPAGCCSMLLGLPWVVLLAGITGAFDLELCLHFLVSRGSFRNNPVLPCLRYLGKACGTACSLSPICLHPELLGLHFYKQLNHTLQNRGSLEGPVPSSASLLDPDVASSSVGCWRCESPAPGQYFMYFFSLPFSSQDLSSWVCSLAIGRQQSMVVL